MTTTEMDVEGWQAAQAASASARQSKQAQRLLDEERKMRIRSQQEAEAAVQELLVALRKQQRTGGQVAERLRLENRMLNDLLEEQVGRCVDAERNSQKLAAQVADSGPLQEQVESLRQELASARAKEETAVAEITRRAAAQAILSERIHSLEVNQDTAAIAATTNMRAEYERDRLEHLQERVELQKRLARAGDEALALKEKIKQLESRREQQRRNSATIVAAALKEPLGSPAAATVAAAQVQADATASVEAGEAAQAKAAQSVASAQAQVYALQDKVDRQVVEIIRFKTEVTKREQDVLAEKTAVSELTHKLSALESEMLAEKDKRSAAETRLSQLEKELKTKEQDKSKSAAEEPERRGTVESLQVASLQSELSEAREKVSLVTRAARDKETALQKEIVSLNEDLLNKEVERLELSQVKHELVNAKAELDKLKEEHKHTQAQFKQTEASLLLDLKDSLERAARAQKQGQLLEANAAANAVPIPMASLNAASEAELASEMAQLLGSCQGMANEVKDLRDKLVLLEEQDSLQAEAEMGDAALIKELEDVKAACFAQQETIAVLKAGLIDLQNADVEALQSHSAYSTELKSLEAEFSAEAEIVRREAASIASATAALSEQLQSLYLSEPDQAEKEEDGGEDEDRAVEKIRGRRNSAAQALACATLAGVSHAENRDAESAIQIKGEPANKNEEVEDQSDADDKGDGDEQEEEEEEEQRPPDGVLRHGLLVVSLKPAAFRPRRKRRRYCQLRADGILVFHKLVEGGTAIGEPKGYVRLSDPNTFVIPPKDGISRDLFKFQLRSGSRLYDLAANSRADLSKWITALSQVADQPDTGGTEDKDKGPGQEESTSHTDGAESQEDKEEQANAAGSDQDAEISEEDQAGDEDGTARRGSESALSPRSQAQRQKNYFELLEIEFSATAAQVEQAFQEKKANFDPAATQQSQDASGDSDAPRTDPAEFELIEAAYNILSNPSLRKEYVMSLRVRSALTRGIKVVWHTYDEKPSGVLASFRSKFRGKVKFFYADPHFARLYLAKSHMLFSERVPHFDWAQVAGVEPGDESQEMVLSRLSPERKSCSLSIKTRDGACFNIEVDSIVSRDTIVTGLQFMLDENSQG